MCQRSWVLLLVGAMVIAGCGRAPSLKTYRVTGTVTYNGKPVSGATVSYLSKIPDAHVATAITEPDGRFSLSTYVGPTEVLKGAVPGDYQVVVIKQTTEARQAAADATDYTNLSEKDRADRMVKMWEDNGPGKQQGAPAKPASEIPLKYAKPDTSGLQATVVVGENDPREFKLTDD